MWEFKDTSKDLHRKQKCIRNSNIFFINYLWFGIGGASAIGLKELKKQGIKVITKAVTKVLAKFAGPIGAAIMVADFGFCLYRADQD